MNAKRTKEDEKIFVAGQYDHIEKKLNELEELLIDKASQKIIQTKYKDLKNWFKNEYRETQKQPSEYVIQWYASLVVDIYIQSFNEADTNASVTKITDAVWSARDYFHGYKSQFIEGHSKNN